MNIETTVMIKQEGQLYMCNVTSIMMEQEGQQCIGNFNHDLTGGPVVYV